LLARVRQTPGVQAAAGEIFDLNSNADVAKLIDKHERSLRATGARPSASASTRRSRASTRCG
jgi:hypothetical protein